MKIAILGTFDLQNYGDLLFPLLARHELARRLDGVQILPFSYRSKDPSDWPYIVMPVQNFPQHLADIDAVLVGGGHLARFDHNVAPQYGPPVPEIHHPTGLWLVPPFLAAAAGKPVVWNGVGASPAFSDWAIGMFRSALEASTLVSVRDRASRATLAAVTDRVEVEEVPDTAFGIADLLQNEESEECFTRWKEVRGIDGPYVVIQPSPKLKSVQGDLLSQLEPLRAQGITLVEAPIGPVLGDRTGLLPLEWTDVVRLDPWPNPLLLARIIAHAEASVGVSLHLGITSLAHGVPVHRPRCWPGLKYEILGEFRSVYQFDEHGDEPRLELRDRLGRRDVGCEVERQQSRLTQHWDRVAEAILTRAQPSAYAAVGRFFFALPFNLIEAQLAKNEARSTADELGRQIEEEQRRHEAAERDTVERLSQETTRRVEAERRNERLEGKLDELTSAVTELASLQSKTDAARSEAAATLAEIHRSRAWRTAVLFRKVVVALGRPWRYLHRALKADRGQP